MDWGMNNRLAQLIQPDGHCLFLPVDHGYFQGPTRKLEEPRKTIEPLLPYPGDGAETIPGTLGRTLAKRTNGEKETP